jgi:hypothetical protein
VTPSGRGPQHPLRSVPAASFQGRQSRSVTVPVTVTRAVTVTVLSLTRPTAVRVRVRLGVRGGAEAAADRHGGSSRAPQGLTTRDFRARLGWIAAPTPR